MVSNHANIVLVSLRSSARASRTIIQMMKFYYFSNGAIVLFCGKLNSSLMQISLTYTHTRCAQISTDLKFDGIVKLPRL